MTKNPDSMSPPDDKTAEVNDLDAGVDTGSDELVVKPPTQIGRFVIEKQLGQGGFGFVYQARDTGLDRVVAIKVPRWDRPLKPNEFARFLHEGRTLAKVHHPAIVSVFDVGETDGGLPYVVMELVRGQPLRELIRDEPLGVSQSLEILLQIGEALQVAHASGIVHRDLKPSNVIVKNDGQIKLVDFGLALHDDLCWSELPAGVEGTPIYMAPEQIRGENHRIDGQTDIWSFGINMYRLLTGKMPFRAKSIHDLARQICYRRPRPLRQWNDEIPPELERICLRCLSKKLMERYQSVADVLNELKAAKREIFEKPTASHGTPIVADANDSGGGSGHSAANSKQDKTGDHPSTGTGTSIPDVLSTPRIVPKGLHPFSETDGEFFLSLLPGPRDRHGIPESLRFWKSRFTSTTTEDFTVGLIYGPSGCGKSSFARAGLLPQLPATVLPVYLDCAGRDTETRLVRQIHRVVESVAETDDLVEVMRQLRNGDHLHTEDKVLLVLDQFEQWLSAHGQYQGQTLTEALRQCDGQKVCCLLLVRDDFWMSVCGFLSELEVQINDGHNAMALPLFDDAHARDVLAAIGRAYQRLPQDTKLLKLSHRRFLRDAVESLSTDGKVICVHLSVFAEMMKDKEWTSAELKRLGGLQGVGVRFLEETFSSPVAPVEGRRDEPVARKILEQLLPESSTTIKGAIKNANEIYQALSTTVSRDEFVRVMRFLDHDVKLIASIEAQLAEPEGASSRNPTERDPQNRYYHLAHDFLVEPIRQWLHNKKLSDWRGRAELQLENLGDHWNQKQDSRFFPGMLGFARIQCLVDANMRNKYRHYLVACRQRYSIFLAVGAVFLGLSLVAMYFARSSYIRSEARRLADIFLNADPLNAAFAAENLKTYKGAAREYIVEKMQNPENQRQLLHSTYFAVGNFEDGTEHIPNLVKLIRAERREEFGNIVTALRAHPEPSLLSLKMTYGETDDAELRTKLSLILLSLGDNWGIIDSLKLRPDPTDRVTFIHSFAKWQTELLSLVQEVNRIQDYDVHSGICLALGQLDPKLCNDRERDVCINYFSRLYRDPQASGGAHSAAEWALFRWGQSDVLNSLDGPTDPGGPWFIKRFTPNDKITFVKIQAGKAELGVGVPDGVSVSEVSKHEHILMPEFYMSSEPVSQSLFLSFLTSVPVSHPARNDWDNATLAKQTGTAIDRPASHVSWNRAIEFCHWLLRIA